MNVSATIALQEILEQYFGFTEFKSGQEQVIERLVDSKSTLAVFPTGGGKSLCYQLPALIFEGLTVVVSPLIALMKDQIDQLASKGIVAVRLDSSLSFDEYQSAMTAIRSGTAKLLYVAPERFFNERFRSSLADIPISLFAVDEAHCISQWGHNFRPDYLKLALIVNQLKAERVLALTATATPAVQDDICKAFEIASDDVICTDFFRPNLHIRTRVVGQAERTEILIDRIQTQPQGATIVYVTLQKTAEAVAEACVKAGLDARAYHAGMAPQTRNEIQEWFMNQPDKIVVATIAFGMGIDKRDIRYVYHYNVPKSIENYVQEIGRAGRDGEDSKCEMLLVPDDRIALENFIYGDTPSPEAVHQFIKTISQQPDEFHISHYKIGSACDIKSIVVKTLMTYLELDGYLQSTAPRYDTFKFKPRVTSAELLANFTGEKQQFAKQVLACAVKKSVWLWIDIEQAIDKLGCPRSRIVKALDYFDEKGWIELQVSGLVHGYRKLGAFESVDSVADQYAQRMITREHDEIARIDSVFEYACATSCQAASLSEHFGQPLEEPCGSCTYCTDDGSLEIETAKILQLDQATLDVVKKLKSSHADALPSSRSIARLLCGITSPALTRAKLSREKIFGTCSHIPFADVMKQVEAVDS